MNLDNDTRTVLLVDDEAMVRNLARVILERNGFKVIDAASGEEAAECCRRAEASPDCAIVDYTMPEMNGRQTLLRLREILPGLPAIIASGYNDEVILEEMAGVEVASFIQKPYRQDVLLQALRALFDPA